jgi:hypothetical protein
MMARVGVGDESSTVIHLGDERLGAVRKHSHKER